MPALRRIRTDARKCSAYGLNVKRFLRLIAAAFCCCIVSCAGAARYSGGAALPPVEGEGGFSRYILAAVQAMPQGCGYASDRAAEVRLAERGIVWDGERLRVSPRGAAPTFCSAACYMVLLQALSRWDAAQGSRPCLTPRVWHSLRVESRHPDGFLSWGRANANGPGFAKWVSDLGAGVNFTDPAAARPGDFLKFFHTPEIGRTERGHLVVFLGTEQRDGQACIRFWSANSRLGYGIRSVPLSGLHHLIFTRITRPAALAAAPSLPPYDPWLASMLTHPHSFDDVCRRCNIIVSD